MYNTLLLPYSLEIKRTDFRDLVDLLRKRYLQQDPYSAELYALFSSVLPTRRGEINIVVNSGYAIFYPYRTNLVLKGVHYSLN